MTTQGGPGQTTVFRNGALFDGHHYRGAVGAVVVADGRIAAVRAQADPAGVGRAGPDMQVVDLAGGLIAPGFVDAHVHPIQGGLERLRCDLSEHSTREEYLAAVAAYAAAHPEVPWILGGGWAMPAFPGGTPRATDLDAVVPDRPVFLPNRDHHGAWVNSRALELAGIDRHTPDPRDGRIERDGDGHPTGTLHEGATALVSRYLPQTTGADYHAALMAGQRYLHSLGVTGWQDAIVGSYAGIDDPASIYVAAATVASCVARGRRAVVGPAAGGRAGPRPRRPAGGADARAVPGHDGEGHAGRCRRERHRRADRALPRRLRATHREHRALLRRPVPSFAKRSSLWTRRASRSTCTRSATAPCAKRWTRSRAPTRRDGTTSRTCSWSIPTTCLASAELGVAANIQALWACLDDQMVDLTLPFLGEERARWQYPFGDLHRAGARLVAGSDWPVSTPDPLAAIHVAVNRWVHGAEGRAGSEAFLPEQALALETAFAAYTSGSAWVCSRDDAGMVAPGNVADLVVLDRDPFAGPPEEIGAARVANVWVDGMAVHEV